MSSKEVDSAPNYLYDLCDDKKWDEVRGYLKQSNLSTDIKKDQIHWKNKYGLTTFFTIN